MTTKVPIELSSTPSINDAGNATAITIDSSENVTFEGTTQSTRLGLGVAPHATAGLNITNTDQHIRLNNGSELGIISLESDGALRIWSHGDSSNEIEFYQGSGSGSASMTIDSSGDVGIGTTSITSASSGRTVVEINGSSASALLNLSVNGTRQGYLFADTSDLYLYNVDSTGSLALGSNSQLGLTLDKQQQLILGGYNGADSYTPAFDQDSGYTNNLNAGAFGILHRNDYDCYITGNAYYYLPSSGSGNWHSKYPAFKSTILSMLDGRFVFDTTSSAPGGSGIVPLPSLVTAVRIDSDGLKFGTDSAAANALDDYEEGTWTPVLVGNNSESGQVYGTRQGTYTKIGRQVNCQFNINLSTEGSFGANYILLSGFPFTISSSVHTVHLSNCYFYGMGVNFISVGLQAFEGNSKAYLWAKKAASTDREYVGITDLTNSTQLTGQFTYFI